MRVRGSRTNNGSKERLFAVRRSSQLYSFLLGKRVSIEEEESGIQPSVSEDEMKNYLEEVLNEIKVRKA